MTRFSTLVKLNLVQQESKTCSTCGRPLEPIKCFNCGGKGTTGFWFWKRTCKECGGIGTVLRCPKSWEHTQQAFQKIRIKEALRNLKITGVSNSSLRQVNKTTSSRPTISYPHPRLTIPYRDSDNDGIPDIYDPTPYGPGPGWGGIDHNPNTPW